MLFNFIRCSLFLISIIVLASGGVARQISTRGGSVNARVALVDRIRVLAGEEYPGLPQEQGFKSVLRAVSAIDRADFVPVEKRPDAYRDAPLDIGYGQTISEPYIVVIMTAATDIQSGANVLEIGTGSGYQAAVLARLGAYIHSIEIVPQLAVTAAATLRRLGIGTVTVKTGDGFAGWGEFGPYDAIIVTAGASEIPTALTTQLKLGGKLIMPVGANTAVEQLILLTKLPNGGITRCSLGPALFVPLTGIGRTKEVPALYDRSIHLCRRGQTARWPGQPVG
jgi:protein-L-isoaspartate(D-aspartate) O-methyltransferase